MYNIIRDEELLQLEGLRNAASEIRIRAIRRCYIKLLRLASNPSLSA